MTDTTSVLALDVGNARIGVALAAQTTRFAQPLLTLPNDDQAVPKIKELLATHTASTLVVGLPRGLDGQETAQTAVARAFAQQFEQIPGLKVVMQDEAGTSVAAEEELRTKKKDYHKSDIDKLAATYILEDYLGTNEDPA